MLTTVVGVTQGGHPIWHFAIVAAAGVLVLAGVKATEWWRHQGHRLPKLSLSTVSMSLLAGITAVIHGSVCSEHFREWIVYGVFFVCASTLQMAWAVLVVTNRTHLLLKVGAIGNTLIVVTYLLSRTMGVPFGPDAFHPETFDALSLAATFCEVALVGIITAVLMAEKGIPKELPPVLSTLVDASSRP
jgi:hypothetical protein